MKELGRCYFSEFDEVGIYEVEEADLDQRIMRPRDVGDIELVWFDQQDPGWPITLPREMLVPLAKELARIAKLEDE